MNPIFNDEAFIKAREDFNKKAHKQKSTCTSVGWFDGEKYVDDGNYQCHIGLNYYTGKSTKDPVAIFSGFQRDHNKLDDNTAIKKEIGSFFFDWIKGHPVWGRSILNNTFQDVWDDGWVFSTDQERNALCSAVFATRWPTEFPMACKAFKTLVEAGTHPDIAFLSSTIMTEMKGGFLEKYVHNGHMPCSSGVNDEFVKSFLNYQVHQKGDTYKKDPGYSGIDKVFDPNAGNWNRRQELGATKVFQAIMEGIGNEVEKWRPTTDIFFTKRLWEKQFLKGGRDDFTISKKNLKHVAESLNNLRKELIDA